ncbi:hypothetical protein E0Z10_g5439 [Xylaria hypoxylon]|uniref:Guanylate kinase-like domain-containing protein n=1 Tax=Xylaria hypoxylon TaxID=37992 RepID=A0A4Z0Z107_9PEZI|nr:hypothetical protein E0Z10_g5439 [Xylaria hypoxylon]
MVSIVFVHGLRGHPQRTWEHRQTEANEQTAETPRRRHRFTAIFRPQHAASTSASVDENRIENNVFWPRDYLLEDVSEAEVPIIFIAHGLGGIVVKDAIRRSELCQSRTKLIVFLGTPHRGSSSGGWGVIASNLVSLALQDSNKRIVQTLEPNSEILDNIHDEFLKIVHRASIKVHSFQEARPISGVVDDYSSKVGLPPFSETVESIDANHMQMARCKNKLDSQYQAVSGVLKQFIRSGKLSGDNIRAQESVLAIQIQSQRNPSLDKTGVGRSTSSYESRHYLPFLKNKRFTGRLTILGTLKEKLFTQQDSQKLAIVGLGGVGKTQVALELAYWVKETKPNYSVFWVPALSDSSFEQAYTAMARRLNIQIKADKDLKVSVRQHLESEKAGQWFLIVDNADDPEILFGSLDKPAGIYEYLPKSDNGLILFTTRSRAVAVAVATSDVIDLHEMNIREATEFLKTTLINKQLLEDKATLEELFQELTHLPLAIAQAAAYLNQTQMSTKKYLALLRNTERDLVNLMSREFHDNTRYQGSQNAVATTWLIKDAIEIFEHVVTVEKKTLAEKDNSRLASEHQLATAYLENRQTKDAIEIFEHVVAICQKTLAEEDNSRLASKYELARAYLENRQISEAIILLEHVVANTRMLLEEDHFRLTSEHELARAYIADGRISEAITLLAHVVAITKGLDMNDKDKRVSQDLLTEAYIKPPSIEVPEARRRGRGTENEEDIQKRLMQAQAELKHAETSRVHDAIIVNDEVRKAFQKLDKHC